MPTIYYYIIYTEKIKLFGSPTFVWDINHWGTLGNDSMNNGINANHNYTVCSSVRVVTKYYKGTLKYVWFKYQKITWHCRKILADLMSDKISSNCTFI